MSFVCLVGYFLRIRSRGKSPLNHHHLGNIFVIFPSTEQANLSFAKMPLIDSGLRIMVICQELSGIIRWNPFFGGGSNSMPNLWSF